MEHLEERREARYHDTGEPTPGEWRHAALSPARPEWFDRPVEEREVVAHKTYAAEPITVDEAVFDLDLAESDFLLFVDAATGLDSVVHRRADGTYELVNTEARFPVEDTEAWLPLHVEATRPPALTINEARDRLEVSGDRFVFFVDPVDERGRVLYHRYDGHYGLVAPGARQRKGPHSPSPETRAPWPPVTAPRFRRRITPEPREDDEDDVEAAIADDTGAEEEAGESFAPSQEPLVEESWTPEQLETDLEGPIEAVKEAALHLDDALTEAIVDEGRDLSGGFDADETEWEIERHEDETS